jgi:hypothetical protein
MTVPFQLAKKIVPNDAAIEKAGDKYWLFAIGPGR